MPDKASKPQRDSKGELPAKKQARGNIAKPRQEELVPLNFRVPARVRRDFKILAATTDRMQMDLIVEAIEDLKRKLG